MSYERTTVEDRAKHGIITNLDAYFGGEVEYILRGPDGFIHGVYDHWDTAYATALLLYAHKESEHGTKN